MTSLLQLPGEIRNQIYQHVLVKAKPFVVKLQFSPHETALFRVNKQIYAEASTIFYHYNIFSFPQALFDGPPILEKLENFIRLPLWRVATLKNFKIDVPVYHFDDAPGPASDVAYNALCFVHFIRDYCSPDLKVQIDVGVAAFLDDTRLTGTDYWDVIWPWTHVQSKVLAEGGIFEIIMRIHPQFLSYAMANLEQHFEDRWFLIANVRQEMVRQQPSRRFHSALIFSDLLRARGLRSKYDEIFDVEAFTYTLSIRRDYKPTASGGQHENAKVGSALVHQS